MSEPFRGSIAGLRAPLSTLRCALAGRQRMTRGHRDSLGLRCRTLSFPSLMPVVRRLPKIGSSTSLAAVCTILSRTVEMPKLLSFPERFGINRSRAGSGTVGAILELHTEPGEDTFHAHLLNNAAGLTINTGGTRPPVAFHPFPRDQQRRGIANQVEQIAEALLLILGRPSVQLGLPSQYPLLRPTWRQAARAYSRPTSRTASHATVLLSAFAMWTAFPPSDYYADSDTPRAHQPTSSLPEPPPAARRARGVSHVHHDPFDRVGSRLYPYSQTGRHSQHPAGHQRPDTQAQTWSEPP